jgi:hypothetical protein
VVHISEAFLIDQDDDAVLKAWAGKLVRPDPDIKWMLGNYVEADNANSNGHIFPLGDLLQAQRTLAGKPLNMMHREHYIVGSFTGGQLVDSAGAPYDILQPSQHPQVQLAAASARNPWLQRIAATCDSTTTNTANHGTTAQVMTAANPTPGPVRMEALAGLWHRRFPEEMFNISRAHKEGQLFYSMESVPSEVECPTCGLRVPYEGSDSPSYCDEMRGVVGPKILHGSNFCGGAVIIPPVKPGWTRADITTISRLVNERPADAEAIYAGVSVASPHLSVEQWEAAMAQILLISKDYPAKKRRDMADKGHALPDGSFPIKDKEDLLNAIRMVGRAKDPASAKAHIKKRAKALGLTSLIPDNW